MTCLVSSITRRATEIGCRIPSIAATAPGALPLAVHNAGVELHHALGVRYAPQSHGCIGGVGLGNVDAALDSVED